MLKEFLSQVRDQVSTNIKKSIGETNPIEIANLVHFLILLNSLVFFLVLDFLIKHYLIIILSFLNIRKSLLLFILVIKFVYLSYIN